MIIKNLFAVPFSTVDSRAIIITIILAVIYFGLGRKIKKGISPIMLIIISAVLGIAGYAF